MKALRTKTPIAFRCLSAPNQPVATAHNFGTQKDFKGFSLLEVVGVLAVLAILATAIFSTTTKSLDAGFSNEEKATLQSFANGLQNNILHTRNIPGTNNWFQQIANELGLSTTAVLYNPRNPQAPRAFMIDLTMALGPTGVALPPYVQGPNGSVQPTNCRVMIVSSLGTPLPTTGVDSANFASVWNTSSGFLPSNGFSSWGGRAEDLNIQRINLGPLFVRLSLTNSLPGNGIGQYTIDTNPPALAPINAYFLKTTQVQLLEDTNSLSITNVNLLLSRDCSYFYVDHIWRDIPCIPVTVQTNDPDALSIAQLLGASETLFYASARNANGTTTPENVSALLNNFMTAYTSYAATGPNPSGPLYTNALAAQATLTNALFGLLNGVQQGQCLPPGP